MAVTKEATFVKAYTRKGLEYRQYTLTSTADLGTTDRFKITGAGRSFSVKADYVCSEIIQPSYLDEDKAAAYATDIRTRDEVEDAATRVAHPFTPVELIDSDTLYIQLSPAAGSATLAGTVTLRNGA